MIDPLTDNFERAVRSHPEATAFTFIDAVGRERSFSYEETRRRALRLARQLRACGNAQVAVDLPNDPAFVVLLLAAAYGGLGLVILNHRLTDAEKRSRLDGLAAAEACVRLLDRDAVETLLASADDAPTTVFDPASLDDDAVVLFTTGTTSAPKAVPLTWRELIGAADAANVALGGDGATLWQAALPLYHVGGLQVVIRSLRLGVPFRLYERFDPARILADAARHRATHLSVVDKMLQDLLAIDDAGGLAAYRCILVGGGPLNPSTVEHVRERALPVFASYGMTETASLIAASPITADFDGGLRLLPGYRARIVNADADGYGELAVGGPGVMGGYRGAPTRRADDGLLLTGDRARLADTLLHPAERREDLIISGGENISPAQIAAALMTHPSVRDAAVFGVEDATWGARPVAIVETSEPVASSSLRDHLKPRLSRLYEPKHLLVVEALPRQGIGKIDHQRVRALYEQRLAIAKVRLYRVRIPFRTPLKTAQATIAEREAVIVELIDDRGRSGLGECDSFATDWYLPEILDDDWTVARKRLAPLVLEDPFAHPRDVARAFASDPALAAYPMICSAFECACWDLYGQIVDRPIWALLNEEYERLWTAAAERDAKAATAPEVVVEFTSIDPNARPAVAAGATIGIGEPEAALAQAAACVDAGYRRVKLKVAPGRGLDAVRAIRAAFPSLIVTADANQSFTEQGFDELMALDELGLSWIEEPLQPVNGGDHLARLSALQLQLATPISLDESLINVADALHALDYPVLGSFTVKVGKFGGIESALRFIVEALRRECHVWIGGMFETGIARRVSAAFETLPGAATPGDIGAPERALAFDIAAPPYRVIDGAVTLTGAGIGCALDREALERALVDTWQMT